MRWFARLLLVWLIALALPIQGVAGVTMLHCGPAHHPQHSHELHEHAHEQHAQAESHEHHGPGLDHAHHAVDKTGCSACAACCAGTALAVPMTPMVLALRDVAHTHAFAAGPVTATFLTGGPERPPRPSLA